MIDTHCHIEKEDYKNIDEILKKCHENGVSKIIISGCDVESCLNVDKLTKKYENVYGTVGYLPDVINSIDDESINLLEKLLKNKKIIGIGEIGLDYYYNKNNKEEQKLLFKKQLLLAKKYNLPVVIHSRDSINDTYEILKKEHINKGTMHCYSGSLEYAFKFIDLGLYISIGGVSTFKNAKEIKKIIKEIDLKHLLLETDSPYLTPEPYRGKRNYPYYIPIILKNIAYLKEIDSTIVDEVTTCNSESLFDI